MRRLDVAHRLEYARAAVAVLRALDSLDTSMRYGDFAKAIGLISDNGKWEPWHRQQVADILSIVAATERHSGGSKDTSPLNFERVVTGTGRAGKGISKTSRIVREK